MSNDVRHSDAYYDYNRNDPDRESPFESKDDGRDEEGRYPADHPSQAFWHDDGVEFVGNPYGSGVPYTSNFAPADTISFTSSSTGVSTLGGESSDTITYSGNPFAETMHIGGGDTIFGAASSDTINFSSNTFAAAQEVPFDYDWGSDLLNFTGAAYTGSRVFGGMSEDTISFNLPERNLPEPDWKYNESAILKELENYLKKTYGQHYSDSKSNDQTLDKIKDSRKEGFFAGNVVKYIDRYDSKGTPRQDLFKVLYYTMLLINHLDLIEEN